MDADTKPCPVCGETIKFVALKCRFCNTDLMAFAAARDLETERDLFSGNPAVVYSIGQILPFLLALIVSIAVAYALGTGVGTLSALAGFIAASATIFLYYYLKSLAIHYQITTQRIKLEKGLLSKVQENLELFRVDHFELRKPIGQRVLGQAALHLYSSDIEFENFYVYGIPNLEALADTLRDCQLRERKRRGLMTIVKA